MAETLRRLIWLLISAGPALSAGATPARPVAPLFDVAVQRGAWTPGEPAFVFVEVKNRGTAAVCAYGGVWDADSMEIHIALRTPRRRLAFAQTGWVPAPPGEIRIEPTKSFRARYNLGARFIAFRNSRVVRGPLRVKVAFRYHLCDSADWSDFETDWVQL